ncbi:hypothetical protein HDU97_009092 [Phlyctochytrium planicorne]|nr:hypothetical protein HDU97_009092 [Phlyctochytrium planicorne]
MTVLASSVVKRFFRLYFPVLFVVFIDRTVAHHGIYTAVLDRLSHQSRRHHISLGYYVKPMRTGWYDIVTEAINTFNYSWEVIPMGALWSLYYEFYGSMILYLIAAVVTHLRDMRKRWLLYLVAFVSHYMTMSFIQLFILGMVIADMAKQGWFVTFRNRFPKLNALLVVAMGTWSCWIVHYVEVHDLRALEKYTTIFKIFYQSPQPLDECIWPPFFAVLMLEMSPILQKIFANPLFHFLGKVSFMVYLLHGILLATIYEHYLAVLMEHEYEFMTAANMAYAICTVYLFVFSWISYLYIDKTSVKYSNIIGDFFVGKILRAPDPSSRGQIPVESDNEAKVIPESFVSQSFTSASAAEFVRNLFQQFLILDLIEAISQTIQMVASKLKPSVRHLKQIVGFVLIFAVFIFIFSLPPHGKHHHNHHHVHHDLIFQQ